MRVQAMMACFDTLFRTGGVPFAPMMLFAIWSTIAVCDQLSQQEAELAELRQKLGGVGSPSKDRLGAKEQHGQGLTGSEGHHVIDLLPEVAPTCRWGLRLAGMGLDVIWHADIICLLPNNNRCVWGKGGCATQPGGGGGTVRIGDLF